MEKALHGDELVDLRTFLEREGTDRRLWKIKPCCPECGREVDPFNVKTALAGIQEASHEILSRGRQKPGFDHKDDPFDNCPNSFRNDPRFHGLRDLEFDIRTRERNLRVLMQPHIRAINGAVLNALMQDLTGHTVAPNERQDVWNKGKKWLLGISALAEYPWIMPYALALLQDKVERHFSSGHGVLAYRDIGRQFLPYTRYDGLSGLVGIPESIELDWVNVINGRTRYKPFLKGGTDRVVFELSEDASRRLALRQQGPRPSPNKPIC